MGRLVLAALVLALTGFGASAGPVPQDLRGILALPRCSEPDDVYVITSSTLLSIYADATSIETITAEPAEDGWTRLQIENGSWWQARRIDDLRVEERWLADSDPATSGEKPSGWERGELEVCDSLPPTQSLLHGEATSALIASDDLRTACAAGPQQCAPAAFAIADVTTDGRLSVAEIARMVRIGAYFAALAEADGAGNEAMGLAVAAMLPVGPLAGAAIVGSFDYDGDGGVSLPELMHDRAGLAAGVAGIAATGDADLARALDQLGALERTVRAMMR